MRYWEQFKENKQKLYELSQVVLAAPATQVSVERAFSGLKYVLLPLRMTHVGTTFGEYTPDT